MKIKFAFLILYISFQSSFAQGFSIELFSSGFLSPLDIQSAGDERLFILEKNGIIKIVNSDGSVNVKPFIDLSSKIDSAGEGGLLGLAFHPNYSSNGYFFVSYIDLNRDTQISRFVISSANPNIADPSSELSILNYERDDLFHFGGAISFGPDEYLYIASGDGLTYDGAQDTSSFFGKILRIDIDNPSGGNNYGIPPGNPYAGSSEALQEIWALGLRNPWKFSFDSLKNNIWIADVGESTREEINRVSLTESGINYGWPCYEGTYDRGVKGCPPSNELEFPIAEYSHDFGFAVIGGYVYRGSLFPDFYGSYIFADIGSNILGWIDEKDEIHFTYDYKKNWSSLGVDNKGEIYLAAFSSGEIYKLHLILATSEVTKPEIFIYPNPTSDYITIKLKEDEIKTVTIYDSNGREILNKKDNIKEVKIQLSNLSKGLYIIEVKDSSNNISYNKLIIK